MLLKPKRSLTSSMCRKEYAGFTIVELMVCAMIISILVAFAAVGISRSMEVADREKATAHTEILNNILGLYTSVSSPKGEFVVADTSTLLSDLSAPQGFLPPRIKALLGNPPSLDNLNRNLGLTLYEVTFNKTDQKFEATEKTNK